MQREQLRRLGPGFYSDGKGAMHVDVPEVLAHFGVPDTPENREGAMNQLAELMRELLPSATQIEIRREG